MQFKNAVNGYSESASAPWLWALLFGPIYFLTKGMWRPLLWCLLTGGVAYFVYIFIAGSAVRAHYLRMGFLQVN